MYADKEYYENVYGGILIDGTNRKTAYHSRQAD